MRNTGLALGSAFCKELGVDPDMVSRIVIDCSVMGSAKVTIYGLVDTGNGGIDRFKKIIDEYELVIRGEL